MADVANPVSSASVSAGPPTARVGGVGSPAPVISIRDLKAHCQTCSLRELCLPVGLTADEMKQLDMVIAHRTTVRRHETLYRAGELFHALYAIQFGSLKTTVLAEDGREQMTGFHMLGEIVGFDGIGTNHHCVGAIALEDSEVCVVPFDRIDNLARTIPSLQHILHQIMSNEFARVQDMMLFLGSMRAEERLAMFLLDLADRYHLRGYSSTEYILRMTREEIGSYIGLKLETVSRLFSRFHEEGLLQVQGRAVKLVDLVALKQIVGQRSPRSIG